MKTLKMIAAMAITLNLVSCANAQDVPQKVKDAFSAKFPSAKSVHWGKENDSQWEAEFKMDGMEYSANYTMEGTWKETEHEVDFKDVPMTVQETLKTTYPGYKIKESEISETPEGMVYEFEIKQDGKKMEVAVNAQGNMMKKEMKEDGKDNEMDETDDND